MLTPGSPQSTIMISRLFTRRTTTTARNSVAALLAVRQFRTTVAVLGGHGHHDEAPPPHVPRPASAERTWFGEQKPARLSKDDGYKPGADDYKSFFGAFVGVALTVLAVKKYTFKDDDDEHGSHKPAAVPAPAAKEESHKDCHAAPAKEEKKEEAKEAEHESEPKEPLHPVVEKKLVIVPVEVEKAHIDEPTPSTSTATAAEEPAAAPLAPGQIPKSVPYLLVGGGTASYYAALVIRARDANARVLIVTDEAYLPYNRPPLSKELWWYGTERTHDNLEYKSPTGRTRDVFQEAEGFYVPAHELPSTVHGGVSLIKNKKVVRVDAKENKAYLDDGTTIAFEHCLLATGGRPRALPQVESASEEVKKRVIYYRGVDDYRKLDEAAANSKSITVVGGGFLGSELAYSLKRKHEGLEINQYIVEVIADHGQLASVLPEYLSKHANEEMTKIGVKVHANASVSSFESIDNRVRVTVAPSRQDSDQEKKTIDTDLIVVAIGIEPNVDVAKASGFEIDPVNGGIVADAEMRVRGNVFAAGDACSYYDAKFGRHRTEHWEGAQTSGRLVGENMTGGAKAFWFQPSFFTKIAPSLLLNAVGDLNAEYETCSVYAADTETGNKYDKGVVFYMKDDKIVGVLLVNLIGGGIDIARRLVDDGKVGMDMKEVAKLFTLYDNHVSDEEKKNE